MPLDYDPFVGEILLCGFNFAPQGWALCQGQILSIAQNTALFSILGTTYGGDGKSTFALPDLRGRGPLHVGEHGPGPGLSSYDLGEQEGVETVTLLQTELPLHTHAPQAAAGDGNDYGPANDVWAADAGGALEYGTVKSNGIMAGDALANAGGSQPHNNMAPYLVMNYCIALQGVYPPRA